jgi:hypothetical protein
LQHSHLACSGSYIGVAPECSIHIWRALAPHAPYDCIKPQGLWLQRKLNKKVKHGSHCVPIREPIKLCCCTQFTSGLHWLLLQVLNFTTLQLQKAPRAMAEKRAEQINQTGKSLNCVPIRESIKLYSCIQFIPGWLWLLL